MKYKLFKVLLISLLYWHSNYIFSALTDEKLKMYQNKGFLVLSIPVKLDNLEPISFLNAHTKLSLPMVYESLVSIGTQQELQPILAESWTITSDNKSIIMTIKPGHYFSDNSEVTTKDIANSISRVCSNKSKVSEEIKGLSGCEERVKNQNSNLGIQIIDNKRIKFNINCSPTNFLYQLSSPSLVIIKSTPNGIIGSGPYIIKEKSNDYLILKKNPFANRDNQSLNPGIIIFYSNWDKLASILEKNKADGSIMYKMQDVWNLKNPNFNLIKINPNITEILVLNNQRFPFNNTLFRKAFSTELYNNFNPTCVPGAHKAFGLIPFGTGGSISGNPPKLLNEISSKKLLDNIPELKHNKISITIHQLFDAKNNCESTQIINAAKKFNVDLKFKYHNNYKELTPLYINHNLDGFIELYVFRNREAYSILQFFTKDGSNHANINNRNIDTMLHNATTEISSHKRFQYYQKIANYIQNEGIIVPLFYMDHANILSKCIVGISDDFLFNPFLHLSQLHKKENCNF